MTSNGRITVLVAAHTAICRAGLVDAFAERPEFELVCESSSAEAVLEALKTHRPDVAVIDVKLPHLDGTEVARVANQEGLGTRIALISSDTEVETVRCAIEAGARAYLPSEVRANGLCDAVREMADGKLVIAPEVQEALETAAEPDRNGETLTEREREVLQMLAGGGSADDFGERLHISPSTVKTHLRNVYRKLDVGDRAEAVAEAMRRGLIR